MVARAPFSLQDPYAVLKVRRNATTAELKRSYHELSRKYHPDKDLAAPTAVATARFQRIKAAYDLLADPARRRAFDATVIVGSARPRTGAQGTPATNRRP